MFGSTKQLNDIISCNKEEQLGIISKMLDIYQRLKAFIKYKMSCDQPQSPVVHHDWQELK